MRRVLGALLVVTLTTQLVGCAMSRRPPSVLARGEIAVTIAGGIVLSAEGAEVARSPTFRGLPDFVGCTEPARTHALEARSAGRRGRAFAILGVALGLGSFVGFAALADRDHGGAYLGAALGSGFTGLGFAIAGFRAKRIAYGRALDAANEYNDAVGSLGATCRDLRYAPPSGPGPEGAPLTAPLSSLRLRMPELGASL